MFLRAFNYIAFHNGIIMLSLVLLLGLYLRFINLNYNSPFSDEAIYVVIGQLGLFKGDWVSYNPASWLSGSPYFYPPLTALGYMAGGIVGSRVISAIAGVLLVLVTFNLTQEFARNMSHRLIAGLISAVLVTASTTALYVSRLATMDMVSFLLFFSSLLILQKSINKPEVNGKGFFIAAVILFISSLFKLTTFFYFPLLLVYGLIATTGHKRVLFINYFILPLLTVTLIYGAANFAHLKDFVFLQATREKATYLEILEVIFQSFKLIIPFAAIGILFAKFKMGLKPYLFLIMAALWLSLIHLFNLRIFTLDKHLASGVVFLAILSGVGTAALLNLLADLRLRILTVALLVPLLAGYVVFSYQELVNSNHLWTNADKANQFLSTQIQKGDKVLTETGSSTLLTLYPKTGVQNISTFDYLKYGPLEGEEAYRQSIRDGYFRYIELERSDLPKTEYNLKMHKLVADSMEDNYNQIFNNQEIIIYRRAF